MALDDFDASTTVAVRSPNGDHHHRGGEYQRLRDPRIHGPAPSSLFASPPPVRKLMIRSIGRWRLIGSFAVDGPRYSEPIGHHAKTRCPECLLERHRNSTVLAQLVKNTLGLSGALDLEREREAFWCLVAVRRDVATHQHLIADRHTAVHHLVLPVGRHLIRQGCPGVPEDRSELTAETLLIELERCLALSVKAQIWIHLHGCCAQIRGGIKWGCWMTTRAEKKKGGDLSTAALACTSELLSSDSKSSIGRIRTIHNQTPPSQAPATMSERPRCPGQQRRSATWLLKIHRPPRMGKNQLRTVQKFYNSASQTP